MSKIFIVFFILFFISCSEESDFPFQKECRDFKECPKDEECRLDIEKEKGVCVKRIKCEYSYECDNNRNCLKDYELDEFYCGTKKKLSFFTQDLPDAYLNKDYYYKIELSYPQGEYYFVLKNGELPKGLTLTKNGEIKGKTEGEIKEYEFEVEVFNFPENSKVFYVNKSVKKTFKLNVLEYDFCENKCSKFQYCDENTKLCIETRVPDEMSRIYLSDERVYQGYLIAVYDHSQWWWDNEDKFTYALFNSEYYESDLYDESIMFFDSNEIKKTINSSDYMRLNVYDDFLAQKGLLLSLPFDEEVYVINGNEGYHKKESGFGDFAYDFVINDEYGSNHTGSGENNEDYYIYNKPVYSPVDGEIFEVHDNNVDNVPGEYEDESQANMVGIKIKGNYSVYLLHLKRHSIPLFENNNCNRFEGDVKCFSVGDKIKKGDYLGRVGNSGVSLIPHLHLTMFFYDLNGSERRVWSVPSLFDNLNVRNIREEKVYRYYRPQTGDYLKRYPGDFQP